MRELALNNLYFFCRGILGFDFMVPSVHGRLCKFLEKQYSRKQITLPRGFLKTTVATIGYSIWSCLPPRREFAETGEKDPWHDPNNRILICQNIDINASKRVNSIKTIFEQNKLFQNLFPEIIPQNFNKTRWSDSAAQINRSQIHPEATFEAAGVGTALTSRHYTKIIEDDIIAAKKDDLTSTDAVPTLEEIEKAIGFHKTIYTLLVDQKTSEVINIGTRWARHDPIQYIVDNEIPPYVRFTMGVRDKDGKPTYPERFDEEVLAQLKATLGPYLYSSQYENNPLSEDEMVFRPEWFQYYDVEPEHMTIHVAVDPAISLNRTSNYTAIVVAGITDSRKVYVLEYIRRRMNPSDTIDCIFEINERRHPSVIYVETVAYQEALRHFLDKESITRGIFLPIAVFKPGKVAKAARIRGIQPIASRGYLYLKKYHKELVQELLSFPDESSCDDLIDALSVIISKIWYPEQVPQEETPAAKMTLEELIAEIRKSKRSGLPFKEQVEMGGFR